MFLGNMRNWDGREVVRIVVDGANATTLQQLSIEITIIMAATRTTADVLEDILFVVKVVLLP